MGLRLPVQRPWSIFLTTLGRIFIINKHVEFRAPRARCPIFQARLLSTTSQGGRRVRWFTRRDQRFGREQEPARATLPQPAGVGRRAAGRCVLQRWPRLEHGNDYRAFGIRSPAATIPGSRCLSALSPVPSTPCAACNSGHGRSAWSVALATTSKVNATTPTRAERLPRSGFKALA